MSFPAVDTTYRASPTSATLPSVATLPASTDSPAWTQAIEFGIDVTLLEANLARTPAERIAELVAMNRVQAQIQSRTLDDATRRKLDAAELRQKFGDLLDAAP